MVKTDPAYPYADRVTINNTINQENPIFTAEINLILDESTYEWTGGLAALPFQDENFLSQLNTNTFLGDYVSDCPPEIITLERFFLWCALKLNRPNQSTISPNYPEGTVLVSVTLPLDYDALIVTGNDCLAASKRINTDLPDLSV